MSVSRTRAVAVTALGAAALTVPSSALAAPGGPGPVPPLNILLTNDDGFAAPGLQAVRQALTAAGHRVTVVAPAADQSGVGTAMTVRFGDRITARQESPGVWSVAGTPTDSVTFGLQVVFAGTRPDLVVSGSNFGHNAGAIATHSGTVGAAVTGLENGVPAIAVSTELDLQAGQEATLRAFPATAAYVAGLVGRLRGAAGGRVLPAGVALNVNYPITASGPRGTKVTRLGRTAFVVPAYQQAGPDTYVITPRFPADPEPVRGADTTALAQDYVSVTPLDADWTHPVARVPGLTSR
ncbi:5'/3'-nucleotidase SurE [Spirillospora sp. NPDC047279]|uniref:5'/3'-nucleotidase SurE n=1 Tax=Spirillospora sp. NPDC047279 TaxID=3155478 RepID=UPI003411B4DE